MLRAQEGFPDRGSSGGRGRGLSAAAVSAILAFNSISACSADARAQQAAVRAASGLPRRKSQRGDSATMKLPMTNRIPGGADTQKMPRQAACP